MSALGDTLSNYLNNSFLDGSVAAYHFNRDAVKQQNLNENNKGFGLEHDSGKWRQMLGYYDNSYNKHSNYALLGYTPLKYDTSIGQFKLGGVGGLISGYPNAPIVPAAGLLATYQNGRFGANLMAVPSASNNGQNGYGFAGLQLRYKLGNDN